MKRTLLIVGMVMIIAAYVVLNATVFQSQVEAYRGVVRVVQPPVFTLTPVHLIGAMIVWYALCWINIVQEWNRRPIMRFGRYIKTLGPGISLVEPLTNTTLADVPVQDVVLDIDIDNMQTKDNVGLAVDGVLTYRIDEQKVRDSVVQVADVAEAILQRALTTLTDVGAKNDIDQFLEHREQFSTAMVEELRKRVASWGVTIVAFELKHFKINDQEIEKSIAMKARAKKEAEAELERAKMQKSIAVAINDAANTYTEQGRWLKGLETLVELCRSAHNNTILIPSDLQAAIGTLGAMAGIKPKSTEDNTPSAAESKVAA